MTPVGLKLGLSVGVLEGDFVGCTDGVDVGYSEKWKDNWVQMKKYVKTQIESVMLLSKHFLLLVTFFMCYKNFSVLST